MKNNFRITFDIETAALGAPAHGFFTVTDADEISSPNIYGTESLYANEFKDALPFLTEAGLIFGK